MHRSILTATPLAVVLSLHWVMAGGGDYAANQSADVMRILSRNATLEGADAAFYNPAGTALMDKSWYIQASNQSAFLDYSMKYEDVEYTASKPAWIIPNAYVLYNGGRWAAFFNFTAPGGTGDLDYKDGIPTMARSAEQVEQMADAALIGGGVIAGQLQAAGGGAVDSATAAHLAGLYSVNTSWHGKLEGSSMYLGFTLGASHALGKMLSVALAGRVVTATRSVKGSLTYTSSLSAATTGLDPATAALVSGVRDGLNAAIASNADPSLAALNGNAEADVSSRATGIGGIVGIDIRLIRILNIGLRFETPTPLDFEYTVNNGKNFDGQFVDGRKERHDLPAVIAGGAELKLGHALVTASLTGYPIGWSDQEKDHPLDNSRPNNGYNDAYGTGWDLSAGAAYTFAERLTLSAGYSYSDDGGSSKTYTDNDFALNSQTFGVGARCALTKSKKLFATLSYAYVYYTPGTSEDGLTSYDKTVNVVGIGLEYR